MLLSLCPFPFLLLLAQAVIGQTSAHTHQTPTEQSWSGSADTASLQTVQMGPGALGWGIFLPFVGDTVR